MLAGALKKNQQPNAQGGAIAPIRSNGEEVSAGKKHPSPSTATQSSCMQTQVFGLLVLLLAEVASKKKKSGLLRPGEVVHSFPRFQNAY